MKVTIDLDADRYRAVKVEAARTDRTKLLVFVSPSNPSGAVYSREQIEAMASGGVT